VTPPTLSYDLASPYAYLAVARAERVLGVAPVLEPVLVGAIFGYRGRGSWALTAERAEGEAEIERRAARYGLPPVVWPEGWPVNSLQAMRAATWATRLAAGPAFAHAAFHRAFAEGGDLADLTVLEQVTAGAGLDPAAMRAAIASEEIKLELRRTTEAAWEAGVTGVPTLRTGGRVLFGDDRLEEAA
jgi:2-hydroxychromene-2-carboxylate isomerase